MRRSTRSTSCRIPRDGVAELELLAVDHVAQVVPQTEFLSWILFYRAILGLHPEARADLNDPRGLIVSRALDRRRSFPPPPAQRFAGAGERRQPVHRADGGRRRTAYRVQLPGRVRRRRSGAEPAAAARSPRTTTRIFPHASGLMMPLPSDFEPRASSTTATASGEFLHFFTRTINGLFFEVLERRGGYGRYGEANAPARLAAQALLDRSSGEIATDLRG